MLLAPRGRCRRGASGRWSRARPIAYWALRDYGVEEQLGLERIPNSLGRATGDRCGVCCSGLKNKDLVGIPWREVLGMQADGYYLRSETIWEKPNAIPESIRDRPTKSHEHICPLSKNERYLRKPESIKEPLAECNSQRTTNDYRHHRTRRARRWKQRTACVGESHAER